MYHRGATRKLVWIYSRKYTNTSNSPNINRENNSPGGCQGNIFVVKYLSRFSLPSVFLCDVPLTREKKKEKGERASETKKRSGTIDSTCTRASFLIFQWASYALESSAHFPSTPLSPLATRFCKPLSNLHPTSTLPPAARSTACLSIYLHIFVIFRDVNPWAFLSLSLPFPTPCFSERELNVKTRLRLFPLSFSLSRSLPALSDGALLSNSRLATASSHSLGDFSQLFFFVSVWLSLLLCRCNESFRFFGSKWARSTRSTRRALGWTIRAERVLLIHRLQQRRLNRVYLAVEIFRERKRDARGTPKGFKGAEIVSAVMKYAGAQRDLADPSFYLPSWSNGKLIPQAEEHLHSRNSRQIPYMKHELPLGLAKVPKHRYMKYA